MPTAEVCGPGGGLGGGMNAGGFGASGISSRRPDGTNGVLQGGGGRAAAIGGGGPSGGGAATGGCAASRKGFPHLMQNFTASGTEAPHAGQVRPTTAAEIGRASCRERV